MLDRPTLPKDIPWTEAEDNTIRAGRDSGLTSSQLAAQLGRTRNAIIGRARRIKLPHLENIKETLRWTPAEDAVLLDGRKEGLSFRRIAAILGNRTESAVKNRRNQLIAIGVRVERRRPPMPIRVKVKAKPAAPNYARPEPSLAPESLKLLCEELKPNSCRYIAGDPKDGGTYCGHETVPDESWCSYHMGIVYQPSRVA